MTYSIRPRGVCSREMQVDVDEQGIIQDLRVLGGCSGNLQGISKLVEGKSLDEVETLLAGIKCRNNTSCPDQLSKAIGAYKKSLSEPVGKKQ